MADEALNFLITGGAGFIGSHVCERFLAAGHNVWALDDLNDFYDPSLKRRNLAQIEALRKPFVFIQGDVTDEPRVRQLLREVKFDQIIHLAARAGVRPSLEEPALYQRVNVVGTANILEAARKSGVAKVTLASSSSVYGVNKKVPFAENDPVVCQISPYAASKLACEALGHVYHHVYGMEVVVLRFFTVYGPRQRPDLAIHAFARRIAARQPIQIFGDGSSARDYTYISDIVDGIMACTRRTFGYEVFNLGGSNPITLSRLVELVETAMGRKALVERKPDQPGDVPRTWADVSKSGRLLGYSPKVKIEEGIPLFVDWFRGLERSPVVWQS